jgi:TonB family protein
MNASNTTFRRNFVVALIAHGILIAGLFALEMWMPTFTHAITTSIPIEIVVPAAPLGELPVGPGHGAGPRAPTPPGPPSATDTSTGPGVMPTPTDETPAPPPTPAVTEHSRNTTPPPTRHNDVGIPKPTKVTAKPVTTTTAKPVKPTKPEQNRNTTSHNTGTVAGATKPGPTADQIRQRLLSALTRNGGGGIGSGGTPGGSPLGDGRPAGGGTGKGKLGSLDGSPDGIPGGIGPGSPNWQYYLHVHDKVYEAWDQSVALNDRKLASVIIIKVARDGNIVGVTLRQSSGNKRMDDSAVAAGRKVQMLEPPPSALVKGAVAEILVEISLEG